MDFSARFLESVGKPLQTQVDLREFSHFKIGGRTDYFFEAASPPELSSTLCLARDFGVPVYIIGGGFNILFSDSGYRGLIVKNSVHGITQIQHEEIEVHSGTSLHKILHFCAENDLGGLEFMAGIPGTLGGAVYGNAGAFGSDIGACLKKASLLDSNRKIIDVDKTHFHFSYRYSHLKVEHDVLLKASLFVEKSKKTEINKTIEDILKMRKTNHPPWDTACAGSYFKNPLLPDGNKIPAAKLLDKVGAKGLRIGGAAVYDLHANFIINVENASSENVRDLASELKRRVMEEFGIELEEEVIYLPEFGTTL